VLPEEKKVGALGLYGAQYDFANIKGAVEALLDAFAITDCDVEAVHDHPTFHPGRCAVIRKNGRELALIGEAHPLVCEQFGLGARAWLGRINTSALFELGSLGGRVYTPLPRFPASMRDLALVCDDAVPVLTIEKTVKTAVGDILESIELFDCYRGEQIPAGKKSLAFSLVLRASDRTLTDADVSQAMQHALEALHDFGAELRA
jgi:phenylalanyl-tRNA synthetase beta chain